MHHRPPVRTPWAFLVRQPLYLLLPAGLVAVGLWLFLPERQLWLFLASCLAIVPLAGLMGRATENLSETLGAGLGGLLNATFGNAAELIIALAALLKGPHMYPLVKASLTGSIIGNVLLVLGMAIFAGGLFHKKQTFNRTAAGMGATLLALASIGLVIPTICFLLKVGLRPTPEEVRNVEVISEEIAGVLAATYGLSLLFSLRTHRHLFAGPEGELPTTGDGRGPEWGRAKSLIVLAAATAGVAVMSEFLVGSVEHAAEALHMNNVFVGVIVVAVVGNAAEHSTAVLVAVKNKMDLALGIAVGSSIQIALFVAPVLVFATMLMGHDHPLDLHFTAMEVVAVVIAIGVYALVSQDGETHWMEGVMLLAVYLMLALAFFHLPGAAEVRPAR
ncbi:MAG TPA: calcium/proton exchanger [Gemmataceae bacterium]|nr:calcium/proton exchanger [Gemmataceae bacterium]